MGGFYRVFTEKTPPKKIGIFFHVLAALLRENPYRVISKLAPPKLYDNNIRY